MNTAKIESTNKLKKKTENSSSVNFALNLRKAAQTHGEKKAFIWPVDGGEKYSHLTFNDIEKQSNVYANAIAKAGIKKNMKTIVMAKPGPDFYILMAAIFKIGAVPVFVDPGMGLTRMLHCLKSTGAEAFIGIPLAHAIRVLRPGFFKSVSVWITIGKRWFWGGPTLNSLLQDCSTDFSIALSSIDDLAAISFTTGSTGPAKGVEYTQGTFKSMLEAIREDFNWSSDDIDLVTFPLFAILDNALGITAVLPDVDLMKPAKVDPDKIITPILDLEVGCMFGSPALLNRIGQYCIQKGIRLPKLKRVFSGGAPLHKSIMENFLSILQKDGQVFTTYGATEALPISQISSNERLGEISELTDKGYGTCLGYPMSSLMVKIIKITDDPIENLSKTVAVKKKEIGEIILAGDLASKHYHNLPDEDNYAKIIDGTTVWHRMGDLGWIDDKGRLWFCGRKKQRVETREGTFYTVPCETIFNSHKAVYRSALVGAVVNNLKIPVICIELEEQFRKMDKNDIKKELYEIAQQFQITKPIKNILFHKSFPVDIRHNAKIFREKLTPWAEKMLKNK